MSFQHFLIKLQNIIKKQKNIERVFGNRFYIFFVRASKKNLKLNKF
jgi:hypothetical protein